MRRLISTFILCNAIFLMIFPNNLSIGDSIVISAMRDELQRNMTGLQYADYEKPFFISYTLADIEEIYISASLGALISSKRDTSKTWAARVMVGNYEINDENYDDYNNIETNEVKIPELPKGYDYLGIRRSLWLITNNIYKRAGLSYKNKLTALKNNNLTDSVLQIPDFSKSPVVKIYKSPVILKIKQPELDQYIKQLSKIFLEFPEIIKSEITLDAYNSRIYFLNSEGTESVISEVVFTLKASAELLGNEGEKFSNNIVYHVTTPDELPAHMLVEKDIRIMIDNLLSLKNAPSLEENYYGPVLFMGQTVAQVFEKSLFTGTDKLIANREPLINSPQMKMFYSNQTHSIEDKIDKRIASNDLTIIAYPKLKSFNGTKLLGSFDIDAEGVIPPDEIVLVENGILKTLLNDRTPTRKLKISNGHKRYSISYSALENHTGPGVISISSSLQMTVEELKQKLLEKVKEEGLDYGIIIKPIENSSCRQTMNIYRIWAKDEKEELISSAYLKKLPSNPLKRIVGSSGGQEAYNLFSGSGGLSSNQTLSRGLMVTYLVPEAVLFEENEVINVRKPVISVKPVVKSPLELLHSKE